MTTTFISNQTTNLLFGAIDLSKRHWVCCFRNAAGLRREFTVPAYDLAALKAKIDEAADKLGANTQGAKILHEAGRDGFAVHRALTALGYDSIVADPGSFEQPKRGGRRRKTDRIDTRAMADKVYLEYIGEKPFKRVRIISAEDEDLRHLSRERERLVRQRTAVLNELGSLFAVHGLSLSGAALRKAADKLDSLRNAIGEPLRSHLKNRISRAFERLELIDGQVVAVEAERDAALENAEIARAAAEAALLSQVKGVGTQTAFLLSVELFWRDFDRSKQVGAATGLVGTPFDTGGRQREQGIEKAGNRRVRTSLVQLAWRWLRWQKESHLTKWYERKWGGGSKRQRRIGIVALARRLAIALWRLAKFGQVPAGAVMKTK